MVSTSSAMLTVGLALIAACVSPTASASALRYDTDYPLIGYAETPKHNAIVRLQTRLDRGELRLEFKSGRGYLDSLLQALDIDVSSQTLVFSKTSLQFHFISPAKPRAIYFNDETYVAWVQAASLLEITTLDSTLGPVFYTLVNDQAPQPQFARETSKCLACHDTFSMMGGGVPRFLVMSSRVDLHGEPLTDAPTEETTDRTPIAERWAGWYVTGQHGDQTHLGNILTRSASDFSAPPVGVRHGNLRSVAGLFDTDPYLTDKSDIVALLVLEHQVGVQNLIVRANFKSRTLLAREPGAADARDWAALTPRVQRMLAPMFEDLVRAMLFVDAADIAGPITSSSGFETAFAARGARDPQGRSLRDLRLQGHLFRYPLSYLIYSPAFDALPDCARDYLYGRLAEVLSGSDRDEAYANLTLDERRALLEILAATKPEFARRPQGQPPTVRLEKP